MNEQALSKKSVETPSRSKPQRWSLFGHLFWALAFLAVMAAGLTIVWNWYGRAAGQTVDAEELQPVLIGETSLPSASGVDVPAESITSNITQDRIEAAEHPLDPLLEMARNAVQVVEGNVRDYTATIIKQVRWQDRLQEQQFVFCKIRHAGYDPESNKSVPFSVYTKFLKPKAGQEAIWVHGRNEDKLIAHGPPGLLNVLTFHLDTESSLAMSGNRYSIRSIGMLNLIKQMIEKGERDRAHGNCEVKITRNIPVGEASCTRLEIIHPEQSDEFDFFRAEIYIDDHRNLPIAYAAYLWPEPGKSPKLIEQYLYKDIKINVGLMDRDFDPANKDYKYPGK